MPTQDESLPFVAGCLQERDAKGMDSDTKPGHLIVIPEGGFFSDAVAFAENTRSEVRLEGGDGQRTGALNTGGGKAGQGVPMIAFSSKDHGADAGELAPTLRAMNHDESHQNGGGQVAVVQPYTLASRGRGDGHTLEYRQDGIANAVLTPSGGRGGIGVGAVATRSIVRRLTPKECERLQGFPDGWTEGFSDSVRYKMLGNAVAVPCARWIAERMRKHFP